LPLPPSGTGVHAFVAPRNVAEDTFTYPVVAISNLIGKQILVVEDEPMVAMDLAQMLIAAGCQVIGPAGTIASAKILLERGDCDAALLDANLHGESSAELALILKQQNKPFAFVTGYTADSLPDVIRGNIVLTKPYSQDQLLALVGTLLDQQPGASTIPVLAA
jgi:DNA-binding response OmpR family regulator